ncbi:WD repeat-containing protein 91-like [Glandiceps talaboti]
MATATGRMDELVKDYLLYRGFTGTLKNFEADVKSDRDKYFRADKIVEYLYNFIMVYDLDGLKKYWRYLDKRIFTRLEYTQSATIKKFEVSLLRLYVIHALQNGRSDKVNEFFDKMVVEFQGQPEWKEWFALPFIKNPEQNVMFEMYFTKMWQDTLSISLQNFFSIIFQSMPLPILLSFDEEQLKHKTLEDENKVLKQQISVLQRIDLEKSSSETKMLFGSIKEINEDFADIPKASMQKETQPKTNKYIDKLKAPLSAPLQRKKIPSSAATSINTSTSSTLASNSKLSTSIPSTKKLLPTTSAVRKDDVSSTQAKTKDGGMKSSKQTVSQQPASQTLPQQQQSQQSQQQQQWSVPKQKQRQFQEHDKIRKELFSKGSAPARQSEPNPTNIQTTEYGTTDDSIDLGGALEKDTKRVTNTQTDYGISGNTASVWRSNEFDTVQPFIVLSQEEYIEHHSSITQCRFSTSGTSVASADTDGVVKVWSYSPCTSTSATIMSKSPLLSLEWVTNVERWLLLGSSSSSVKLFDTEAKRTVYDIPTDAMYPRIVSLACNPGGSHFISSATKANRSGSDAGGSEYLNLSIIMRSGKLWYWDLKAMKVLRQLPLDMNTVCVNCTQFNHNGHLLVTGGSDGFIRLYDMQRYECLMSWKAHSGEIYCVQFSPDENSVYSMGGDGKFINWSVHRLGDKLFELAIHDGATGPFVVSGYGGYKQVQTPMGKLFAFDVEGNHVLTCSPSGGIIYRLSDKSSGLKKTLTLLGHRTPIVSVDWSTAMNCGMCLTGSMDGRIKVTTLLTQ